jgi:hypothetical protein
MSYLGPCCALYVLVGRPEGKRLLEDLGIDDKKNVEVDFKAMGYGVWFAVLWLMIGTGSYHM